ncbi:MAG: YkgJ family cysteine cluster protein [Polyangiaceae bacterium]|jgi:Fe-S-cluster containining protein
MTEKVRVEFELEMGDQGVRVALNVPVAPMPARRMLPVFQGLTQQVLDVAVAAVERAGEAVSCKAGCGACCRHIVPISMTEARQIEALVRAMPEPKRSEIRARFADAVARLDAAGMLEDVRTLDALPEERHRTLHSRYFAQRIPCPFLEEESCSVHPQRPLICREYLVTSPPELCRDAPGKATTVRLSGFVSHAVTTLEGTNARDSRLALVLALEWSEAHAGDEEKLRPAVEWIDAVLERISGKPVPAGAGATGD